MTPIRPIGVRSRGGPSPSAVRSAAARQPRKASSACTMKADQTEIAVGREAGRREQREERKGARRVTTLEAAQHVGPIDERPPALTGLDDLADRQEIVQRGQLVVAGEARGPLDQPSRSHHVSGTTAKASASVRRSSRSRPAVIASTLSCDAVLNRLVLLGAPPDRGEADADPGRLRGGHHAGGRRVSAPRARSVRGRGAGVAAGHRRSDCCTTRRAHCWSATRARKRWPASPAARPCRPARG